MLAVKKHDAFIHEVVLTPSDEKPGAGQDPQWRSD